MHTFLMSRFVAISFGVALAVAGHARAAEPAVVAVVETTLGTASANIRQFAFDGDDKTYFASSQNPSKKDHFTLVFDKPVAVKSIKVTTGDAKGEQLLDAGVLEVSADGKTFTTLAKFAKGVASARPEEEVAAGVLTTNSGRKIAPLRVENGVQIYKYVEPEGQKIQAVRVQPADDMTHPLAIREFTIESNPPVSVFKYPVEFTVIVTDAPEMKEWAEKSARICEREYTMINEELKTDGFKPRTTVTMSLTNSYKGVAAAGGGRITGSVKYFKDHPNDFGAMVHETVHIVQSYRTRNNPGWLVEGVADYVRFFIYEPGKIGRIRGRYDGAYRETAAFLAYVSEKYDKELVKKLNKAMREGEYKEEIWKTLTKKTVQELGEEWKASLTKKDA
jgi:Peptidase of plants and bacteria